MKSYLLKIRGGVEVDSYGKKAGKGPLIAEEISNTLGVSQDQTLFQPVAYAVECHQQDSRINMNNPTVNQPITSNMQHDPINGGVILIENHPQDSRVKIKDDGICQTLDARMGMGGGNVPMVMEPKCCATSHTTYHLHPIEECAPALTATDYKDPPILAIDRAAFNQGENAQYDFSVDGGVLHKQL